MQKVRDRSVGWLTFVFLTPEGAGLLARDVTQVATRVVSVCIPLVVPPDPDTRVE